MTSILPKVFRLFCIAIATLTMGASMNGCKKGDGDDSTSGTINVDIPGVQGPVLEYSLNELRITAVFESFEVSGGLRYEIPKYDNSYVEIGPDFQSSGTLMVFYIALEDLADENGNIRSLPPQTLPGGRPLPGVRAGKLPAVAFTIESFYGISFYLGNDFFGVFIPLDINTDGLILTSRFNSGGKRAGNLSLVGKDKNGENSGFLLMLDLNAGAKAASLSSLDEALSEG